MSERRKWPCVCVDIETLGTAVDAVILEIGAVCFDPATGERGATFSCEVSAKSQHRFRVADTDTIVWWMGRVTDGIEIPGSKGGESLWDALVAFADFLREECAEGFQFWAWGVDFDAGILKHAYESCFPEADLPWVYSRQRDARTFCAELGVKRIGDVRHRALPDAVQEVIAVCAALGRIKVLEQLEGEGEADADLRWKAVEEPDFERGWNAYRRELLETVGMTMLPTWEKLPEQVRESWCVGVRAALGKL